MFLSGRKFGFLETRIRELEEHAKIETSSEIERREFEKELADKVSRRRSTIKGSSFGGMDSFRREVGDKISPLDRKSPRMQSI